MTYRVGIDIGSTATKAAVLKGSQLLYTLVIPTGYSSVEAANTVLKRLADEGFTPRRMRIRSYWLWAYFRPLRR